MSCSTVAAVHSATGPHLLPAMTCRPPHPAPPQNVRVLNSNSKAMEKGRNIARNRPQDLFAQVRGSRCTGRWVLGGCVDGWMGRWRAVKRIN